MTFHANRLPADDSQEISNRIWFTKAVAQRKCRLLQIMCDALGVS